MNKFEFELEKYQILLKRNRKIIFYFISIIKKYFQDITFENISMYSFELHFGILGVI